MLEVVEVVPLVAEEVVLVHSVHRHGVGGVDPLPSITPPREALHLPLDLVTLTNVKDHLLALDLDQDLTKTMNHRGVERGRRFRDQRVRRGGERRQLLRVS